MNQVKKKVMAGLLAVGCATGGTVALSTAASATPAPEQSSALPGQHAAASRSLATATVYSNPDLEGKWYEVAQHVTFDVSMELATMAISSSSSSSDSSSSESSSSGLAPATSPSSLHGTVPLDSQFDATN